MILLDRSASMQAEDTDAGSRLEAARQDIHQMIRTLRSRDDMALIAVGATSEVVTGLTGHHRTLHQAVDEIAATDQPTDFDEALKLANSLIEGHSNGEIVLLTDGGFEHFPQVSAASKVVTQLYGSTDTKNIGITQFQIRRNLIDPVGYEVLVEAINQSSEPAETRLELELEGEIVDVVPLNLDPDQTWSKVLEYTSTTGGVLSASLNQDDALASDNEAYAILSELTAQKVILVSEGNRFLEQVFNAIPLVELEVVNKQPETIPEDGLLVFHRQVPETLPVGNVLVIEPSQSTDLWTLGEAASSPMIASQDKESNLMAHVRLDNVMLSETHKLAPKQEITKLASSLEEIPIYFSYTTDKQKVLVLNASLNEGDLPLRTAFPILISNALNWFSGADSAFLESLATGSVRQVDVSSLKENQSETIEEDTSTTASKRVTEEITPVTLTGPGNSRSELIARNDRLWLGPFNQVGLWQLEPTTQETEEKTSAETTDKESTIEIACNLANAQESNLRVPEISDSTRKLQQAGFSFSPLWFYLILFATIFTCVEWYLYQRRWID
ncbi:MAG: VWA domain-containing protein [Planctomycetaceae bacterium]